MAERELWVVRDDAGKPFVCAESEREAWNGAMDYCLPTRVSVAALKQHGYTCVRGTFTWEEGK